MNNTAQSSPVVSGLLWSKSSYSGAEGGDCVEVAAAATHVYVRDSKRAEGPVLTVGPDAWVGFVGRVAN